MIYLGQLTTRTRHLSIGIASSVKSSVKKPLQEQQRRPDRLSNVEKHSWLGSNRENSQRRNGPKRKLKGNWIGYGALMMGQYERAMKLLLIGKPEASARRVKCSVMGRKGAGLSV